MQKQNGFTLVELVVVIIILGILAVTAAPKFINMQGDARVSTLQGVKGAINGANVMVYAKASLIGKRLGAGSVDIGNGNVVTSNGYVAATPKAVLAALNINADEKGTTVGKDWVVNQVTPPVAGTPAEGNKPATDGTLGVVSIQQVNAPEACHITYTAAPVNGLPTISTLPKASDC